MAEDGDKDRTLPATPKRLEQAREEGQVARSRELATCLVLAGGALALIWTGPGVASHFLMIVRENFTFDATAAAQSSVMGARLTAYTSSALFVIAPVLGTLFFASLAAPLAVGGWIFSGKAVTPTWSRLNLFTGLGRIISVEGLAELVKAVAKALLVGAVGTWLIWKSLDPIMALGELTLPEAIVSFVQLNSHGLLVLISVLAVVALVDVPYQLYRYHSRLRMTLDEVKREARESEGDPQLKARIRGQQREMARRRMMAAIPKADVVVTNPTHFAVALKYTGTKMGVPQVVAKGSDLIAQRIRELAAASGIPMVEVPPLARALYRHVEIGHAIPTSLYAATAQVLAYVYHLKNYHKFGGQAPVAPSNLEVPIDLDIQGATP
jgi:flagellar biosynthesis protein FlhB